MKVLLTNEGALTDFEVLQLMQERKEQRLHKSANVAYAERNWMDHKVLKFLTQSHSKCAHLTPTGIRDFARQVDQAGIKLSPAEKLQFMNHLPMELVDIHLIVEDCAGRFSEEQVEELTRIVERTLVAPMLEKQREEEAAALRAKADEEEKEVAEDESE